MSYNWLKFHKGAYIGDYMGESYRDNEGGYGDTTMNWESITGTIKGDTRITSGSFIEITKGDTRSSDHSSYEYGSGVGFGD